jgi:MerR family transcriptional regulator, light-induced transcriptional regulator
MSTSLHSENLTTCGTIAGQQALLADRIVARHYSLRPDLASRYGEDGRARCVADAKRHLEALSQSVAAGRSALFVDYIAWAKILLGSRGIPVQDLAENLEACRQTLDEVLVGDEAALADQYLLESLSCLPALPSTTPSYFGADRPLADLARRYLDALLKASRHDASQMVMDAVRRGVPVREIYLHVFQRSQYEIGRLWQSNQISVAQEHLCTAATQFIMSQLYPLIFATERKNRRVVATCVGGDLHELGIRMVADFFEMDGWDTFYLGADVPRSSIVQMVIDREAHVLAVSTTLLTHVGAVAELIATIRSNRARAKLIILVGGHPFNVAADLWREVGADGYAADALQTIDMANQLLLEKAAL